MPGKSQTGIPISVLAGESEALLSVVCGAGAKRTYHTGSSSAPQFND